MSKLVFNILIFGGTLIVLVWAVQKYYSPMFN
jgi:hypothetical protein